MTNWAPRSSGTRGNTCETESKASESTGEIHGGRAVRPAQEQERMGEEVRADSTVPQVSRRWCGVCN
jgi:hypothetical protein